MPDKLKQLKQMTVVVADTGDINAIRQYSPEDATTNPSLILKAAQIPEYRPLVAKALKWSQSQPGGNKKQLENLIDMLMVIFGKEIVAKVPGRVSTEVDARLSYDTKETIQRAHRIIELYQQEGVPKERILIKIAATWEGIKAAEELEKQNINCNITLLFGFCQAVAAAEAGVFLISPFVGRILDWYKKNAGFVGPVTEDPGVLSVHRIYNYYKKFGYKTIVMGASFRSAEEIEALAGCDRLTIGPKFLQELTQDQGVLSRKLDQSNSAKMNITKIDMDEAIFRQMLKDDTMAREKLKEGINNFSQDLEKLESFALNI